MSSSGPYAALTTWALPKLSSLLPLDPESLQELLTYTTTLSKPAAAEHLKDILGDSPQALEFISAFNSRRGPAPGEEKSEGNGDAGGQGHGQAKNTSAGSKKKSSKASLHSVGPARKPEGYGNIAGAYNKATEEEFYVPGGSRSNQPSRPSSSSNLASLSSRPEAIQALSTSSRVSPASSLTTSNLPSRTASPAANNIQQKSKPPPGAQGPLISDHLFANVRSRTLQPPKSKSQTSSTSASPSRRPHSSSGNNETESIADLSSAISLLERTTNPTTATGKEKRVSCTCNATRHPLFTPAPNCLSCGKIICALEGNTLAPCSFCNTPLFTPEQTQAMINALREERGLEKVAAHNAALQPNLPSFPSSGGQQPASQALNAAESHKNRLLSFQRENARRTKVVDEVADFSAPEVSAWMSPIERAKALKAQQKFRRELDEANRPEWERKRNVISLDVSGGKVRKRFERVDAPSTAADDNDDDELEEVPETEENSTEKTVGTFARNPLLTSSGANGTKVTLVRPIWTDRSKGKGASTPLEPGKESSKDRERPGTWRRVQDDDKDDGEKWVLDGGLHGFDGENADER